VGWKRSWWGDIGQFWGEVASGQERGGPTEETSGDKLVRSVRGWGVD